MIDWSKFTQLAGAPEQNFERLCRALIKLHYARYGSFAALRNQPGVEFHLRLTSACTLGNAGRWWGWQCRWYDLGSGERLGPGRCKKIEDALKTTKRHLPDLTDWVLWTRHPLVKADQEWFLALDYGMTLHLNHGQDVDDLLSGPAEMLRKTYFGELILSPEELQRQHEISVSRVKARWIPEAHQKTEVETDIRRMLIEPEAWDGLKDDASEITELSSAIKTRLSKLPTAVRAATKALVAAANAASDMLLGIHGALKTGDLDLLMETLAGSQQKIDPAVDKVPRSLRSLNNPAAPLATNAVEIMREGFESLLAVRGCIDSRIVAVLADAGGGKTQLAAQLTAPGPDRPAGILLHGRDLHAGKTLDDLAQLVKLGGVPVPSIDALLGALDAAGQRAKRRLPLVIDGLNEAEDPREWKSLLAALDTVLKSFPYVLAVVTLRTGARDPSEPQFYHQHHHAALAARKSFADQALPGNIEQLDLDGFGENSVDAVRKYFNYYKIEPGDSGLPFGMFRHPLTLRIFCEVANPKRERVVGSEAVPRSLVAMFDLYLERSCESIGERSARARRYFPQDVRNALKTFGSMLWDRNAREIPQRDFSAAIGEPTGIPWDHSMVYLLEQEGLVLRIPTAQPGEWNVVPVYDEFGGYLIAAAKAYEAGGQNLEEWLKQPVTVAKFQYADDKPEATHPLGADIFRNLAGLTPKITYNKQLWQLVDDSLKTRALVRAAFLEKAFLDANTVTELTAHLARKGYGWNEVLGAAFGVRSVPQHPLNADFLDQLLLPMAVGDRDLFWTEWLRADLKGAQNAVNRDSNRWRNSAERGDADRLRAISMKWMLTSTQRQLRDTATKALYRYGMHAPDELFGMAIGAATLNDPYVFERLLAASYGVCTSLSVGPASAAFVKTALPEFARNLHKTCFAPDAPGRTTHILIRDYARRVVELAVHYHSKLFSEAELKASKPPYSNGGRVTWQEHDRDRKLTVEESPLRYDFENDVIGSLVRRRQRHDYGHEGYITARARILWRAFDLGWSVPKFAQIDRMIETDPLVRLGRPNIPRAVERYGHKYLQIAYREMAGHLEDAGELDMEYSEERTRFLDIDPTFPQARNVGLIEEDVLGKNGMSVRDWRKNGKVPQLARYLRRQTVEGIDTPSLLLDGHFTFDDPVRRHRIFFFVHGLLVPRKSVRGFVKDLEACSADIDPLPRTVDLAGFLAGEVPWSETVPALDPETVEFVIREYSTKVMRRRRIWMHKGQEVDFESEDLADYIVELNLRKALGESVTDGASEETDELPKQTTRFKMVEVEKRHRETRIYKIMMPAIEMRGHNYTELGARLDGFTLNKRISKQCKLQAIPGSFDLQTEDGARVTFGFSSGDNVEHRIEEGVYMREDTLQSFLDKHELCLVWSVWGEREGSMGTSGEFIALDRGPDVPSGFFRKVQVHKPSKAKKRQA